METIIRLEPPYVGYYFFNGLLAARVSYRHVRKDLGAPASRRQVSKKEQPINSPPGRQRSQGYFTP